MDDTDLKKCPVCPTVSWKDQCWACEGQRVVLKEDLPTIREMMAELGHHDLNWKVKESLKILLGRFPLSQGLKLIKDVVYQEYGSKKPSNDHVAVFLALIQSKSLAEKIGDLILLDEPYYKSYFDSLSQEIAVEIDRVQAEGDHQVGTWLGTWLSDKIHPQNRPLFPRFFDLIEEFHDKKLKELEEEETRNLEREFQEFYDSPFQMGLRARHSESYRDNPFKKGSVEYSEWKRGRKSRWGRSIWNLTDYVQSKKSQNSWAYAKYVRRR